MIRMELESSRGSIENQPGISISNMLADYGLPLRLCCPTYLGWKL